MTTRSKRDLDNARAALADIRTPAEVALDNAAGKVGAALVAAPMSEVLASVAIDLDVCANSDTINVQEVCADLAMELRERSRLEAAKEAAAPDLLTACKLLRQLIDVQDHDIHAVTIKVADLVPVVRQANAAIARAEGGGK